MGLGRAEILELYRLLDWLLRLPEELELEYKGQLRDYEESRAMPYITSIQRIGREEGRQEGRIEALREAIVELIEARFGSMPEPLRARVEKVATPDMLHGLLRVGIRCGSLTDFESKLPN